MFSQLRFVLKKRFNKILHERIRTGFYTRGSLNNEILLRDFFSVGMWVGLTKFQLDHKCAISSIALKESLWKQEFLGLAEIEVNGES